MELNEKLISDITSIPVQTVTKLSLFSRMPKWLRIILIIISILTLIYWLTFVTIKLIKLNRKILAWISQPNYYYPFVTCFFILLIGAMLTCQFCSDWKPFSIMWNSFMDFINGIKTNFINKIS